VTQHLIDEGGWAVDGEGYNDKQTETQIRDVVRLVLQKGIINH